MIYQLRVARPVTNLALSSRMYGAGLQLEVLGAFENHQGFDGVVLGQRGGSYHFELTICTAHPVRPRPTPEDLVVFYLPDQADWQAACGRMLSAGFNPVPSFNPYWDQRGRTFEDPDGYRVVLERADWDQAG